MEALDLEKSSRQKSLWKIHVTPTYCLVWTPSVLPCTYKYIYIGLGGCPVVYCVTYTHAYTWCRAHIGVLGIFFSSEKLCKVLGTECHNKKYAHFYTHFEYNWLTEGMILLTPWHWCHHHPPVHRSGFLSIQIDTHTHTTQQGGDRAYTAVKYENRRHCCTEIVIRNTLHAFANALLRLTHTKTTLESHKTQSQNTRTCACTHKTTTSSTQGKKTIKKQSQVFVWRLGAAHTDSTGPRSVNPPKKMKGN